MGVRLNRIIVSFPSGLKLIMAHLNDRLFLERARARARPYGMDFLTLPLLALELIVIATILVKAVRDHARGTSPH